MKKSFIIELVICGATVLVSLVIGFINKKRKDKSSNMQKDVYKKNVENETFQTNIELQQEKNQISNVIFERHNMAAQIMKETLEENNGCDMRDESCKRDFDEIDRDLSMLLDKE